MDIYQKSQNNLYFETEEILFIILSNISCRFYSLLMKDRMNLKLRYPSEKRTNSSPSSFVRLGRPTAHPSNVRPVHAPWPCGLLAWQGEAGGGATEARAGHHQYAFVGSPAQRSAPGVVPVHQPSFHGPSFLARLRLGIIARHRPILFVSKASAFLPTSFVSSCCFDITKRGKHVDVHVLRRRTW